MLSAGSACGPGPVAALRPLPALSPAELTGSAEPAPGPNAAAAAVHSAEAVVRRYYAALDGLRRRMRPGPLAALLARTCPCRAQVRAVRTAMRRGERYTDRIRVVALVAHLDRPDLVDVVVTYDVHHGGLVDRAGDPLTAPTTIRNIHRELEVGARAGRWQIRQVIVV